MNQIRLNRGRRLGQFSPLLIAPLVESFLELEMETKRCLKCGRTKPLEDFHKNNKSKDGFCYYCKLCRNAHDRFRSRKRREKKKIREIEYRRAHRKELAILRKTSYKEFLLRKKANYAVSKAIKENQLVRPDNCSNPECNKTCIPCGHHWSYLEDHWLDVEWLCVSCHNKLHARIRKGIANAR